MEGKDNIKELFSQKLGNYEAKVNPELWAKISSQVAAGATTTVATGLSLFTKIAIGIGVSAAAIATVVVFNASDAPIEKETPRTDVSNEAQSTESTKENVEVAPANQRVNANTTNNTRSQRQEITPLPNAAVAGNPPRDEAPFMDKLTIKKPRGFKTAENEPTIVPGISYANVTTYGAPSDDYTTEIKQVEKPNPIEKYPNVFTPNGDGENDQFLLKSEGLSDFNIVVFDPKGNIVFESKDPAFVWDGRDMRTGKLVPPGNYMYMVTAYDSERNPFPIYERLEIRD